VLLVPFVYFVLLALLVLFVRVSSFFGCSPAKQ
jgi:hypothetical protein